MASTWAWKSIHGKWVELACMLNMKKRCKKWDLEKYQRLFNEKSWRIKNKESFKPSYEATYKCWVAQVHWAFLRFNIVQVNMAFASFVEVFIVWWKIKTAEYKCQRDLKFITGACETLQVSYLISSGDCMFYTWWYHCRNH